MTEQSIKYVEVPISVIIPVCVAICVIYVISRIANHMQNYDSSERVRAVSNERQHAWRVGYTKGLEEGCHDMRDHMETKHKGNDDATDSTTDSSKSE